MSDILSRHDVEMYLWHPPKSSYKNRFEMLLAHDAALRARVARLEAALREIAEVPCELVKPYRRTCDEWIGINHKQHWCLSCVARAALAEEKSND